MSSLNEKFLCYKGKPLVRCGDTIYYGNMSDDYVVMLKIQNTKKAEDGSEVAGNIVITLMRPNCDNPIESIVKNTEKIGLYPALEMADIWLTRALSEE